MKTDEVHFGGTIYKVTTVANSPKSRVYFEISQGFEMQSAILARWKNEERWADIAIVGQDTPQEVAFVGQCYKVSTTLDKGQMFVFDYLSELFPNLYQTLVEMYQTEGLFYVVCYPKPIEYNSNEVRKRMVRRSRRKN